MLSSNGGQAPHDPSQRALPPGPPLPTLVGLGFASVLGPTRGGVVNVGYSPLLFYFGGTSPTTPCQGAVPPGPPFAHPRGLRIRQRFGPHSWRGCRGGLLAPSFGFVGGHPPQPPARGLVPPGPPFLPTSVGLGFASVLGPTRGQVANVGNSPPLLRFSGAHPPDLLPSGLCPLDPRLPTPVG